MKVIFTVFFLSLGIIQALAEEETMIPNNNIIFFSVNTDAGEKVYSIGGRKFPAGKLPEIAGNVAREREKNIKIGFSFEDSLDMEEFDYFCKVFRDAGFEGKLYLNIEHLGKHWTVSLYEKEKEIEFDDVHDLFLLLPQTEIVKFKASSSEEWGPTRNSNKAAIQDFVEALRKVKFRLPNFCLCTGYETAYFFKKSDYSNELLEDKPFVSIALIHENQIRIHWNGGGGDYKVNPETYDFIQKEFNKLRSNKTVERNSE